MAGVYEIAVMPAEFKYVVMVRFTFAHVKKFSTNGFIHASCNVVLFQHVEQVFVDLCLNPHLLLCFFVVCEFLLDVLLKQSSILNVYNGWHFFASKHVVFDLKLLLKSCKSAYEPEQEECRVAHHY